LASRRRILDDGTLLVVIVGRWNRQADDLDLQFSALTVAK